MIGRILDVTYATSHVFQHEETTVEGGERCVFSSWKYSLCQLTSHENIKVRCALCAGDKVLSASKTRSQIWSRRTAQLSYRASRTRWC